MAIGQRITDKSSEGCSQLSCIAADQVDYIEIIRGTSEELEELDIRGSSQIVSVILFDMPSRSSTTVQV